jgi:hypothetical protein
LCMYFFIPWSTGNFSCLCVKWEPQMAMEVSPHQWSKQPTFPACWNPTFTAMLSFPAVHGSRLSVPLHRSLGVFTDNAISFELSPFLISFLHFFLRIFLVVLVYFFPNDL